MALLQGPRIAILLMLISFPAVLAVLFTPALPELNEYFHTTNTKVQATMSIFLLAYAIGQLPYAPLANRFGRKKTIYIGIFLSLIGTVCCLLAPTIDWFILGRFIQALGGAVGLKITFTMIGDSHQGSQATKVIAIMMMAFAVTPGLGVALGGVLTEAFGWKSCFIFLIGYTLLLALFCSALPETSPHLDPEALCMQKLRKGYGKQFTNLSLVLHAFFMGLGSALIYLFATAAPYVGVGTMGLTPAIYGLWNIIPSIGLSLGLVLSSYFAQIFSARRAMIWGILIFLIGATSMTTFFAANWILPWALFVPQAVMLIGSSWMCSNASSEALSSSSDKAHGAAVLQFINMGCSAVGTYILSSWLPHTAMTLPLVYLMLAICFLAIWIFLRPYHQESL